MQEKNQEKIYRLFMQLQGLAETTGGVALFIFHRLAFMI